MAPRVEIEAGWSDLVFHVLAHVDLRRIAPDLFDQRYVAWVASQPGPGGDRTLQQDVRTLALVLATPEAAIPVQFLAVLFGGTAQAHATSARDLSDLSPLDVAQPASLRSLFPSLPAAELVRSAALLEAPWHAALPAPQTDADALSAACERIAGGAPLLADARLVLCRALTHHGRVFADRIFVGLPDPMLGVSVEHVAWQAGHEANVLEASVGVRARGFKVNERGVEAIAVVLFAQRCARAGLSREHAQWGERWGIRPEHCAIEALSDPQRLVATTLLK